MRYEKEINLYGDAEILKRFQAAETSIQVVQGNISALISASEIIELQNSHTTMYSQMASLKMSVDSLALDFSDLQTKYNTVTGQYTDLNSKVAQYKASVDGLSADITAVEQNLSKNYSTTTAMNAAIKASVDGLSSTVSSTYATKTALASAKDDVYDETKAYTDSVQLSTLLMSKGYADDAEDAANANTANLLKSYSTTTQMNSAITQKANEITSTVSSTYATKTALNNANTEINALKTWKSEASLKITDSAIVSTVTSSSSWSTKADKASLISQINQSAETVAIQANKINFNGLVTANNYFKILPDGSMETIKGKIGGWEIDGNKLKNNQTNFRISLQAPTVYGSSGLGTADVLTIHDMARDTWPFVLTSDGTLDLGDYLRYRPNGVSYDDKVQFLLGGWQVKRNYNVWGYDEVVYWDTEESQENGIGAHGPWVIWGGWSGQSSLDYVNNYKFVVSDTGYVYAQRFYDNGEQLLPIVRETRHIKLTSNYAFIDKPGYTLLNCCTIRDDGSYYVAAVQRRVNGQYTVIISGGNNQELDIYTVWSKNPD